MSLFLSKPMGRPRDDDAVWLEFLCDRCLSGGYGLDTDPVPRCPRCAIKLTPDDLSIPDPDCRSVREPPPPRRATLDDPDVEDRLKDLISEGLDDLAIWNIVRAEFDFDFD